MVAKILVRIFATIFILSVMTDYEYISLKSTKSGMGEIQIIIRVIRG
jgi:hypothetical protein